MTNAKKTRSGISIRESHPTVFEQWHPTLNSISPDIVSAGSSRIAWWKCSDNHEWEARVSSRTGGTDCPYCSGRRAIPYVNDVYTLHPELRAEWHVDNEVLMHEHSPGSQVMAKWICSLGHVWDTHIRNRVRGSGCHVCAGKKVVAGVNDVATTHPYIVDLWDFENNDFLPTQLNKGSMKLVNFKCDNNHKWKYGISKQLRVVSGCPYCTDRRATQGENDLSTTHPKVATEWHPTKNDDLSLLEITASMDRKVWWLGQCGHEWDMRVLSRTSEGKEQNCPICAGRRVLTGFNDLLTVYPIIAAEWDVALNKNLSPDTVHSGSGLRVWWICKDKGHSWETVISYRTQSASGCPTCAAASLVSKAETEIADLIAQQGLNFEQSNRKILKGMELDLYIPEKKIAIEYNGVYWHTEAMGKDSTYHYKKWFDCKRLGIQLLHIWEDDWNRNPEQVKIEILHKLGVYQNKKITRSVGGESIIGINDAILFLEKHHIQGFLKGSHYLGIKDVKSKEIVAAMVLKDNQDSNFEIVRYATSLDFTEGFEKIISYAVRTLDISSFTVLSDHCMDDEDFYTHQGFVSDKQIPPDYQYVVGSVRKPKTDYSLFRFQNDPKLIWEEGKDEKELADLNGLQRIWDAGKTQWVKNVI